MLYHFLMSLVFPALRSLPTPSRVLTPPATRSRPALEVRSVQRPLRFALFLGAICNLATAPLSTAANAQESESLVIGDTFTLHSKVLSETRRINVFTSTVYGQASPDPLPVLYMPDGGMAEDFLHVAGLLQVLTSNGSIRPFLLVGIENTERRRDLTGPTTVASDKEIAPRVGGSASFRKFLRAELMPEISERYRTTTETAIIGESLAGLFVVETLLLEPDLFQTYVAIDPSLWWNGESLIQGGGELLEAVRGRDLTLFLANSSEPGIAAAVRKLAQRLHAVAPATLSWTHQEFPAEQHSTIYHPAALIALPKLFAPPPGD